MFTTHLADIPGQKSLVNHIWLFFIHPVNILKPESTFRATGLELLAFKSDLYCNFPPYSIVMVLLPACFNVVPCTIHIISHTPSGAFQQLLKEQSSLKKRVKVNVGQKSVMDKNYFELANKIVVQSSQVYYFILKVLSLVWQIILFMSYEEHSILSQYRLLQIHNSQSTTFINSIGSSLRPGGHIRPVRGLFCGPQDYLRYYKHV